MSSAGPTGTHLCRACAAEVPDSAPRCPRCNTAQDSGETCPLCGAQAGTAQDHELRFVCDVCGGPRVPKLGRDIAWSGREIPALRKADAARKGRAGWRAAAVASGAFLGFVAFVFLVLSLIFGLSVALVLTTLFVGGPVGAFLAFAIKKAQDKGREIAPALDAAWLAVGQDVAAHGEGHLHAGELSRVLGIAEPQAEELVALLEVEGAGVVPRMRVAPPPAMPAIPTPEPARVVQREPTREPTPEELAAEELAAFDEELERKKKQL